MFNHVNEAIDWVTNRKRSEHPFADFERYMSQKGNPQYQLKCIHVAGTNGKGSTTNYLRSILQAAGYKVGSFTSPHLITHLDRIRINDENIDASFFLDMVNQYQKEFEENDLSMFQIDMFISVMYFIQMKVDYVVYEVGLGGRFDATNVIKPMISVITNIEMDHMQILGDTIDKIAFEKAGIIKENTPVVTFEKKKEAIEVFKQKCEETHSKLYFTAPAKQVQVSDHIEYEYKGKGIAIPSNAIYQVLNSSLAIETIQLLQEEGKVEISDSQLKQGLKTQWAGRFEMVLENPKVIIDGAHNENGIDGLCQSLEILNEEYVIVFSALKDKQFHKMLGKLITYGEVIVTQFENSRMSSADQLAQGYDVTIITDYKEALEIALTKGKTVIVTGSLYFISEVREYLLKKKAC